MKPAGNGQGTSAFQPINQSKYKKPCETLTLVPVEIRSFFCRIPGAKT